MRKTINSMRTFEHMAQSNKDKERKPKFKTKVQDYSNGKWIQKEGAKKGTMIFKKNND